MTGRVLDETKAGVPGATVIVKGSTRGVITGNDGTFSIDVKPTDVIEISYLGYETQSIPVGTKTNIVTELVRKVSELEAVTVVAYGKQRKESIIGAINTIDAGELEVASGSLSSNLAGKLEGIVVMQRTGEPGSSAEFWIRGQSTFGSKTTPLVLVDGIERDMDFVDADDIATFSILKDATATALYGVRGANGIILITTKRGTEMTAPQIRVKAEFGITQPVQLPELANASQWIDYYNELYRDSGSTEMPISDYARQMYLSGRDPDLYPNVDWVNTIFKDLAMTGRVHASVTGGSPKIRYYVSASYYTEGGMFNVADNDRYNAQMNFNKYSFRSNIDIDITKSTQLGLSLSTQYTTKNAPCTTTNDLYAYTMYVTPVATPTVFSNGMLAIPQESGSVNPYNMLNNTGYRRYNTMVAQSLLSLTQDFSDIITPGLKANVKFAWDAQNATLLERAMSPVTYYATGRDENGDYTVVVRQMLCSTGTRKNPSDIGTFTLNGRTARWCYFPEWGSHAQYWTRINSSIAFHSVIYNTVNTMDLSVKSYKNLGKRASHGCIRLTVADAKWIYNNCGAGTVVTIRADMPADPELRAALKLPSLNTKNMLPYVTPQPTAEPDYRAGTMPPQPFRKLKVNSSGEDVYWMQRKLTDLGYYSGKCSGTFLAGTQNAVKAFQKANGLSATGTADVKTLNLLYAEELSATPTPEVAADDRTPEPLPTPAAGQ